MLYIQGEAHKVLQSDSTQTINHIQKVCVNLPSQATFKKMLTNDVIADIAAPTINIPQMLKWYSSHPSRILICPIMHIMPIHISRICEVSFIRKKHMTQK